MYDADLKAITKIYNDYNDHKPKISKIRDSIATAAMFSIYKHDKEIFLKLAKKYI